MTRATLFCEACGYPAYRVYGADYYAHNLPKGRLYSTHNKEFPECWNNARVTAEPSDQKGDASCTCGICDGRKCPVHGMTPQKAQQIRQDRAPHQARSEASG